jgi:hypothetical protein
MLPVLASAGRDRQILRTRIGGGFVPADQALLHNWLTAETNRKDKGNEEDDETVRE